MGRTLPMARPISPSSRGSRRCASVRACTSARPARRACTTWSGRSSTTPWTRRWRAGTRIDVTLLADGGCRVVDNGRGHPGRPPPQVPEAIGGRDRADHAARRRQIRRQGLQGLRRPPRRRRIGGQRPVVAARSSRSTGTASTRRRVRQGRQAQEQGRRDRAGAQGPHAGSATGTTVTFWPDPTIFDETEFRAQTVIERLQIMAFLNRGLEIRFIDERRTPRPRRPSSTTAASSTSSST